VPEEVGFRQEARASEATRRAISWIRDFTSRDWVVLERRRESFAVTQGWVEMWAFEGRGEAMIMSGVVAAEVSWLER